MSEIIREIVESDGGVEALIELYYYSAGGDYCYSNTGVLVERGTITWEEAEDAVMKEFG